MADRVANERDGLHFEMGDPAALARTIKRAATEPGLWPRLAGALPTPPSRADLLDGFRRVYRDKPIMATAMARRPIRPKATRRNSTNSTHETVAADEQREPSLTD
jgi:hypothetical protein